MQLSKQEYWSGLLVSSSRDLPNSGTEFRSPELQADSLPSEPPGKPEVYKTCKERQVWPIEWKKQSIETAWGGSNVFSYFWWEDKFSPVLLYLDQR